MKNLRKLNLQTLKAFRGANLDLAYMKEVIVIVIKYILVKQKDTYSLQRAFKI